MKDYLHARLYAILGVKCGAYGGGNGRVQGKNRWCVKKFGHRDNCEFELTIQPHTYLRRVARGQGTSS
jgi:hypothetical protein